jgi:hypothetical protein
MLIKVEKKSTETRSNAFDDMTQAASSKDIGPKGFCV